MKLMQRCERKAKQIKIRLKNIMTNLSEMWKRLKLLQNRKWFCGKFRWINTEAVDIKLVHKGHS